MHTHAHTHMHTQRHVHTHTHTWLVKKHNKYAQSFLKCSRDADGGIVLEILRLSPSAKFERIMSVSNIEKSIDIRGRLDYKSVDFHRNDQ